MLERAVAIFEGAQGTHPAEASAKFGLAKTLTATGGDHVRAEQQAHAARELRRESGGKAKEIAELDAWLAAHDRPQHGDSRHDARFRQCPFARSRLPS